MPRSSRRKCAPRTAGPHIELHIEIRMVFGEDFGIGGALTASDWDALWRRYRRHVLERYVEAFPGSRPVVAYLTGEVEPYRWQHPTKICRHPVELEGVTIDTAGHRSEHEFEHLVTAGVVGASEAAAARKRLASPDAQEWSRYRRLSRD